MVLFEVSIRSIEFNKDKLFLLVYDVLTGATKLCLRVSNDNGQGRDKCVRDVSWHPYENYIISTSVRFRIYLWKFEFELLLYKKNLIRVRT